MTASKRIVLEELKKASHHFDLTEPSHQQELLTLADTLMSLQDLSDEFFYDLIKKPSTPLEFKLAVKLVWSRRYLMTLTEPLTIGVVYAMWGEHNRLNIKEASNPNGEDSLRTKVDQLNWLMDGTVVDWRLYPVDDGCPHNSAGIAQSIAGQHPDCEKIKVLRLEDVLPTDIGPLSDLASVDDSRKGGSVIYGCQEALKDGVESIMYTDADNSVHLGQIGLLLKSHFEGGYDVVLGNRKHPDSILVKQEERWGVGIKLLRHMQRMIGRDIFGHGIYDTQAAFKLFSREAVEAIIAKPSVYDFSFDTDWILAAIELDFSYTTVPFAFIDSAAESASVVQGPMTTWYTLLEGLIKAVRMRDADHNEEMAVIFERHIHSHEDLEKLIDVLPDELLNAQDQDLGKPEVMSPIDIENWILECKYQTEPEH